MSFVEDFKKFALRGNLVELAIGFTVGAAFTTVAKSLVSDIIMPPIGMLLGRVDFADMFVILRQGTQDLPPYASLREAQAAGAVTLNYGLFINSLVALLIVALAMFLIIRAVNRIEDRMEREIPEPDKEEAEPEVKKCPYCRTNISYRATRCPSCTSHLPPMVPGQPTGENPITG